MGDEYFGDVLFSFPSDEYGQVHPIETVELVRRKLQGFEDEIAHVPPKKKIGVTMAEEQCPEQLTPGFKLMFLRTEVFNVKRAVKRYVKFWEMRRVICGDDRAFRPATLAEALRGSQEDVEAFNMGFARLVPGGKDPSGRQIVFIDSSRQPDISDDQNKADLTRAMARAAGYVIMAALEDETTQRKGVVVLVYPAKARSSQFNREFISIVGKAIQGTLPVRLAGVHICQPPMFFRIVFPFVQTFIGRRLTKRIRVTPGTTESVQEELAKYGLTKEVLPSELGGDVVLDHESWIQERLRSGK